MSDRPHRSHYSSRTASQDTTENLYDLGLLKRPKAPSVSSETIRSYRSVNDHSIHSNHPQDHFHRHSETLARSNESKNFTSSKRNKVEWLTDRRPPDTSSQPPRSAGGSRLGNHTVRLQHQPSQSSLSSRTGRPMAGMLNTERSRTRRERTFIGTECAVCEEPLEHTLRGERVLQFSCGHVSHEACFYEYIKESDSQYCPTCNAPLGLDTNRGGNVLDLGKLSSMVRSVAQNDSVSHRSSQNTPTPWDYQTGRDRPQQLRSEEQEPEQREVRGPSNRDSRGSQRERIERLAFGQHPQQPQPQLQPQPQPQPQQQQQQQQQQHARNGSGTASSADYAEAHNGTGRRHDYDVHAMETDLSSPRTSAIKNPISPPVVTLRSEFPTLNRSRQQQSLTCLITIEVPEGKWHPSAHDLQHAPPLQSLAQDDAYSSAKSPVRPPNSRQVPDEDLEALEETTEELKARVDNWHGLEFERFGKLRLHGTVRVGKDLQSWQELECYLFDEMLICVKEKKGAQPKLVDGDAQRKMTRCTLKGSIIIRRHLRQVDSSAEEPILTLSLSVNELPSFHLLFQDRHQLEGWKRAFLDLDNPHPSSRAAQEFEHDTSGTDEDDYSRNTKAKKRVSSVASSYGGVQSVNTAPTEYTASVREPAESRLPPSLHVPLDMVVVIPVSSSMQGLKITLLRDALKFLVQSLGERDRMGLVSFGSSGGGVPLVGMTSKAWGGWNKIFNAIRPVGQKSLRADVVEGANVAMDLLMQRKSANPISNILLISDSSTSDAESVDFVVQRAEAAKVAIHSFGLGLTHKPDTMIELSSRTKASYTYVKDWMMLRECVAGCLGALQSTSHQNVKLKLKLPEGSPAKFVKISGALQITKRATGRDAEAAIGDLRFGDKRDILVQLAISPDNSSQDQLPQDPWESIVSGLEALGGSLENDEQRTLSVEEVPLLQADLTYGDILRDGTLAHLPRPSLLAITMLPANRRSKQNSRPVTPPIPPHPSIVQRRMELLTSDMLTRALTLVARGQHERAHHLLQETRMILKGLGKGGLPPVPTSASHINGISKHAQSPASVSANSTKNGGSRSETPEQHRDHSPHSDASTIGRSGVDIATMHALDGDIESSLEWINHPAVFSRDSRKAVLQAIGVISSQRGYTFRTPSEALWADRIPGVRKLTERSRDWREAGDNALTEE